MSEPIEELKAKYPEMYENAFDVWVDAGWFKIVDILSNSIQRHIDFINSRRANMIKS